MTLPEPRPDWGTVSRLRRLHRRHRADTGLRRRFRTACLRCSSRLRKALGGAVAIVSGRPIEQIDGFLGTAVPAVAGLHGLERRTADGGIVRPSLPGNELNVVRALLEEFAAERPGVLVEDKKHTVSPCTIAFPRRCETTAGAS